MNDILDRPAHSMRGGSGAYRWTECLGSINLIEKLGWRADYTSEAAAEGTVAHEFGEELLKADQDAWERAGEEKEHKNYQFPLGEEMAAGVQEYLDLCRKIFEEYKDQGAIMLIEESFTSFLDDEAYGTVDCLIIVPGVKIIVIDFKYGRGIVVEPDAMQLKYYGYLAYENKAELFTPDVEVVLYVCQPRIPHPKGTIRKHRTTGAELTEWFTDVILPAMEASRDPMAPLKVGDHCRFCPGKRTGACPALQKEVFEFNVDLEPNHLSEDEIGEILSKQVAITKFFEDVQELALKRAQKGKRIPGKKLVRRTGKRIFRNHIEVIDEDSGEVTVVQFEDAAKETFGDKAYKEKEFRTPTEFGKLPGGKTFTNTWCYQPDKGTMLVGLDDKRDAVIISGDALFGDIDVPETE